jgi:hypothetical protein
MSSAAKTKGSEAERDVVKYLKAMVSLCRQTTGWCNARQRRHQWYTWSYNRD